MLTPADTLDTSGVPVIPRLRTLVVDDRPDIADIAGALLAYHGIDTLVVNSAKEALDVLGERQDIDAMFSDIAMPGMDGLELAGIVRKLYPGIRIVLASGCIPAGLANRQTHSYPYVCKPYAISTVIDLLRR